VGNPWASGPCPESWPEAVLKLVTGGKPMNDTSKHMEIQRLFIKEAIEQEKMTIIHCKSPKTFPKAL